jgi:hypothetical protein
MLIATKTIHDDGRQLIYRYDNGYGASVVQHQFSYGWREGLWELAVIKFDGAGDWELCYSTPITSDVVGWLTDSEVDSLLGQIEALP